MSRLYLLLNLLSIAIFVSCNNSSTDSYNLNSGQNPTTIARINDSIDNNFNNFIEVFSSDSVFQARRIKFPLKTIRRAMNNESDTIVYIEKSGVEMMDFRKKKTSNGYEEW